jgi:Zn-dependent protease with chaperone function
MKDLTYKKFAAAVLSSILCTCTPVVLANPLGGLLGGDAAKALGGMLGGSKNKDVDKDGGGNANPLGGLLGGSKDSGGSSGGSDPFKMIGDAMEAKKNSTLGPMGRYYLGRKLSAQVIGLYKPLPFEDKRTKYVRDVVMTILGASNYAGNYKDPLVVVLDDKKLINAFAAPGNFVFISTGMLEFVESEDELAFVLAHEIAHIELDHGLNAIKSKQGMDLFQSGTGGAMPGLDGLFGFMENGFSANLEGEADERGAQLTARAGYDPKAGVAVIERLEKLQGRKHGTGYPADRKSAVQRVASGSRTVSPDSVKSRQARFGSNVR